MNSLTFEDFVEIRLLEGVYFLDKKALKYDKELIEKEEEFDNGYRRYHLKTQRDSY